MGVGRRTRRGIGWLLHEADREDLLRRFPPRYQDVIAHHVTLRGGAGEGDPLPVRQPSAVVGRADDGVGLECLVVAIGGSTDRPDGSTYHITWSLDRRAGRQAVQSNDVLRERDWTPLDEPAPIRLKPGDWRY